MEGDPRFQVALGGPIGEGVTSQKGAPLKGQEQVQWKAPLEDGKRNPRRIVEGRASSFGGRRLQGPTSREKGVEKGEMLGDIEIREKRYGSRAEALRFVPRGKANLRSQVQRKIPGLVAPNQSL